jgi:hypothetical protein
MARGTGSENTERSGRQARTRGVSMSPDEQALIERFRELSGMGFSEQVRQTLVPKLPAAIQLLEDMRAAGMTPGESPLVEQVVFAESDEERRALREDTYEPIEARSEATAGTSSVSSVPARGTSKLARMWEPGTRALTPTS